MKPPLQPKSGANNPDDLLEAFLAHVETEGLELYPAQEEAILELFAGKNVILTTPTGSGKSLVAAALHFLSASTGRKSIYTCPIKALVNEKFLALCKAFGAEQVGMMTGDASVNRDAPILCCTAEILANIALRDGPNARIHDVIMDEFHYYADPERGGAWQAPLLTLPHVRFLLISATLGDTSFFENELKRVTGLDAVTVTGTQRPVPLAFEYIEAPFVETLEKLQAAKRFPVYIVHFAQRLAADTAQSLLSSLNPCTKEEKRAIDDAIQEVSFSSPFGKEIKKLLRNGIGLHHAGLLPKYRVLIEKLAQRGLVKIICGTDTLGVGVNVPIRTVLFSRLCKYDGKQTGILTARDFHQISGRAGRRGFDDQGYVIAMAPEHVIENKRLEAKAAADPKKKKKLVKKKPPERGFVAWDEQTFLRLQKAPPEPLQPSLAVTHGMLLNVLGRDGDGCRSMRDLINQCHQSAAAKQTMRRHAFQLFRSLVDRNIIEIMPSGTLPKLRVNLELQDDFSLNQTLALYCIDTLALLNMEAPDYPLKLISLAEAILEDPDVILRRQLDKVKDQKVAEMKAAGVEYDARMDELEKLEYPKPERDFIYDTFNQFAHEHPWVGAENIRPKSIAREMFEDYCSFADYVKRYGLMRAEGVLLRHITNLYRVLVHTIPTSFRNEAIDDAIIYFEEVLRLTDSSLIDEWTLLQNPDTQASSSSERGLRNETTDPLRNRSEFERKFRNEAFRFIRMIANKDYSGAAEHFDLERLLPNERWPISGLEQLLAPYWETHSWIRMDPPARNKAHARLIEAENRETWILEQTLLDPDEQNDHQFVFELNVQALRETGNFTLRPIAFTPLMEN